MTPEEHFQSECFALADRLNKEIKYRPTRFVQMVGEQGGVQTAKQLIAKPDGSDGFTALWDADRLEESVEAMVLRPWYAPMFTTDELAVARARLAAANVDVDDYLRRAQVHAPEWIGFAPGEGD